MSKWFISGVLLALSSVALPSRVHAQADLPPAQIAVLDGDVSLLRDGQPITAIVNMPVVAGDRLTTTAGRVEVLFPDGVALDLDEGVTLDFIAETRVRLSSGRAILVVPAGTSAARYEIDTPSGAVVTRGPGKYRADATGSPTSARAGSSDGFEGWSDALRAARAAAPTSASAEHLPQELQAYDATLDQSGTWQYAPTYGYVWYPRVESDWRPYYEGSWIVVPQYGWTWVGVHRWQYPTHHYGRWGYANNRWFWIPGRAYAPAWVAWGYADDYVSWCPLGVDSRPVFALTMGYGNPWVGWTVLSKSHFGGRGYVPRYAVPAHQLSTQTAFVVQHAAPVVPRGAAVPAAGGTIAVPRQAPVAPMPSAPVAPQAPSVVPYPQRHPNDPARSAPYTPPAQRQAPPDSASPPKTAPHSAPPARSGEAPHSTEPPEKRSDSPSPPPPPQTAAPRPAPTQKSGERAKPAETGKARGRGGR